jgi:hypothetical protein
MQVPVALQVSAASQSTVEGLPHAVPAATLV